MKLFLKVCFLIALFFVFVGSNNARAGVCPDINLSIDICDPVFGGPFSLTGANEFFPLKAGSKCVLEGVEMDDDEEIEIRIESNVLHETEIVAGVVTRVVEETEYEDGEIVEIARDFYAVAPDGTVCYFGEDVMDFEDGVFVGTGGQWRAGQNGNKPGIIMPGNPQVGQIYMQEDAPGVAEDQAENIALGDELVVPFGTFTNTLTVEDCNPLDGGATDEKVYVSGIGIAKDEVAELVSCTSSPPPPIALIPTMGQWGMIFAGIMLGIIGIFALMHDKKYNQYFD